MKYFDEYGLPIDGHDHSKIVYQGNPEEDGFVSLSFNPTVPQLLTEDIDY